MVDKKTPKKPTKKASSKKATPKKNGAKKAAAAKVTPKKSAASKAKTTAANKPKTTKTTAANKTPAKKTVAHKKPTAKKATATKAPLWKRIRNKIFPFMDISATPKKKKPTKRMRDSRSGFVRMMRYPLALMPAFLVLWITDVMGFPMPLPIIFAVITYGLVCLLGVMRSASIGITLGAAMMAVLAFFAYDMPSIDNLDKPRTNPGIVVLAKNGEQIARYGDIYGDYLSYEQFPPHLIDAVTSTEDRNFFHHHGIDPKGIIRAMFVNIKEGEVVQGGSTITQQLAKNIFLTSDRTFSRKVQEMLLSFWLESKFTKEEIVTIYLNKVYLGGGNYGVDAASHDYFDKTAKDLNVAESAVIAGLLKAPSRYSPSNSEERATKRAKQVLYNMVNANKITEEQRYAAEQKIIYPEKKSIKTAHASARYFSDWVVNQLPEYIGNVDKDIIITTTLDTTLQKYAQRAADSILTDKIREGRKVSQVALVSMRPDGAVVSMLGGRNYQESQFNRATQAMRQPASAFKMFVYLTAMENGYFPDSKMVDKEIQYGKWKPKNYNKRFRGETDVKTGLRYSINTIAVQLGKKVGVSKVIKTAKRLGVKSKLGRDLSLSLGSSEMTALEMTTAYAHLAANGKAVQPYFIRSIKTRVGDEELYKHKKNKTTNVIEEDVVAKMNSMLIDVVEDGTGKVARMKVQAAGKTGTTSDYKDAWFAGYTGRLATVVWVGNDDASKMKKVTGGDLPAMIWRNYMKPAQSKFKYAKLEIDYRDKKMDLPWLSGRQLAKDPNAAHSPEKTPEGSNLGASFWGKLLDGDKKPDIGDAASPKIIYDKKPEIVKAKPASPAASTASSDDAFKPIPKATKNAAPRKTAQPSKDKPKPIFEIKGNIEVSEDEDTEYVYPGDRRRRIRR